MENNKSEEQVADIDKMIPLEVEIADNEDKIKDDKPTPFLKRVSEIEKKVDAFNDRLTAVENKLNTILLALKTRR